MDKRQTFKRLGTSFDITFVPTPSPTKNSFTDSEKGQLYNYGNGNGMYVYVHTVEECVRNTVAIYTNKEQDNNTQ